MEDVLTATVIGLLKYLPAKARACILNEITDGRCGTCEDFQLVLWPHFATPHGCVSTDCKGECDGDRGVTEPDALLRFRDGLILVEAKYRSHLDEAYDQLCREARIALSQAGSGVCTLLIVTAGACEPTPGNTSLREGVQRAVQLSLEREGRFNEAVELATKAAESVRWVGWRSFYRVYKRVLEDDDLSTEAKALLSDACELLALRNLKPFSSTALLKRMANKDLSNSLKEGLRQLMAQQLLTTSMLQPQCLMRFDLSLLQQTAWSYRRATLKGISGDSGVFDRTPLRGRT